MSTNSPKRPDETNKNATPPSLHQQAASAQKPDTSGTGGQQSTGSMPPTQGTGSTPQSHTPRPSSAESDAHHGTAGSTTQPSGTHGTEANPGTIGGTEDHGTVKMPQGQNVSTPGQASGTGAHPTTEDMKSAMQGRAADLKDQAQGKASDVKDAAQGKASDLRDQAQSRLGDARGQAQSAFDDAKTQAQGKFSAVTSQAQDTLESVKANLQTRSDALKESVSGKSDQLAGTVGEKGDLAKQAANEKSTQAGEKLTGFAGSLRDKTQTLEPDHPVATAATRAAGALEQTGAYLQQSTPDDWVGDLKQLISRKPVESVLVAAGLGYMAARAFRK